jgi:NAD(P)-dependent dehydrogenase (short-subunit alcohol dehydrogenase family)
MEDERDLKFIERTVPPGRPGRIDELNEALVFLARDGSLYATRQTIAVDGG